MLSTDTVGNSVDKTNLSRPKPDTINDLKFVLTLYSKQILSN